MNYIGIDPGAHGAIAVLRPDGYWGVIDMPGTNREIYKSLRRMVMVGSTVVLEEQYHRGLSDRMNGKNLTTFLCHYGGLQMALAALNAEPHMVKPQTWQGALLGPLVKGETKDAAREYASRVIPKLKVKKSQADAVCLALYAKQLSKLKAVK